MQCTSILIRRLYILSLSNPASAHLMKSPSFEEWMEGVWEEKGGGEGVWVGRKDGVALFTRHRQ